MLPLELDSSRVQAPLPMVPFRESPPMVPVAVTGSSELMRPNEVRAATLYPPLAGTRTLM